MSSMIGGNLINDLKVFGIVLGVLVCIDLPMILFINGDRYKTLFNNINGVNNSVGFVPMILSSLACYSLLAFGIYYFAVKEKSYLNAIILGLVVFGVYDLTNLATIVKYDLTTGFIDITWGTTLSLLVTILSLILAGIFANETGAIGVQTTTEISH
jgi:uncharacterized membrane protein